MKLIGLELPSEQFKLDVIKISGPGFMTRAVASYIREVPSAEILILPPSFFYPVANDHREGLTVDNYREFLADVSGPVYTCHLWQASWTK